MDRSYLNRAVEVNGYFEKGGQRRVDSPASTVLWTVLAYVGIACLVVVTIFPFLALICGSLAMQIFDQEWRRAPTPDDPFWDAPHDSGDVQH